MFYILRHRRDQILTNHENFSENSLVIADSSEETSTKFDSINVVASLFLPEQLDDKIRSLNTKFVVFRATSPYFQINIYINI